MPEEAAISGLDDASQARVRLLQSGRAVHAPILGIGLQPLDADLTSWAAVTRAAGFDAFVATPSSANLRTLLTDETGTGIAYFVGGALGTPSSGTATNLTGLPIAGIAGLGTNVAAFLAAIIGTGGYIVDSVASASAANGALTTVLPADDTIPLITEGDQVLSVAISPKTTTNKLRCRFTAFGAILAGPATWCAAMFQGSTCIDAQAVTSSGANFDHTLAMEAEFVPGSTSSVTISVRVGPAAAGTVRLNGSGAGRLFGGAANAVLIVEEVKA